MAKLLRHNKNFKNYCPEICNDVETICKLIGRALDHQDQMTKKLSSGEMVFHHPMWNEKNKPENFNIKVEQIDRLYHIYPYLGIEEKEEPPQQPQPNKQYILLCRVQHDVGGEIGKENSIPIYVQLYAEFKNNGEMVKGEIWINTDANHFLKNISSLKEKKNISSSFKHVLDIVPISFIQERILFFDDKSIKCLSRKRSFYNTHKDFKSIVPTIKDADSICSIVGQALNHQSTFDKTMTQYEMKSIAVPLVWSKAELWNIKVDVEKIDRIYDISRHIDDDDGEIDFRLICRMEYENSSSASHHVYIKLGAFCYLPEGFINDDDINRQWGGKMVVSTDPGFFMDYLASENEYDGIDKELWERIRRSLADDDDDDDDGIRISDDVGAAAAFVTNTT